MTRGRHGPGRAALDARFAIAPTARSATLGFVLGTRTTRPIGAAALLVTALGVLCGPTAAAQPRATPPEPNAASTNSPQNLRGRFGMEVLQRLMRSSSQEDRLRAIRRAAEQGTPEAIALVASSAESNPLIRNDPKALLEAARALAPHAKEDGPRTALVSIVNVPTSAVRLPQDDNDPFARFDLARSTAALALAKSGAGPAVEALLAAIRVQGVGTEPATRALAAAPPTTLRGLGSATSLSPALLTAVDRTDDLRAADVLLLALGGTDPKAKAVALVALAQKGDVRATEPARKLVKDPSPSLRIAATRALVALATKDAAPSVLALFGDEGTATVAVELSPLVENDEVVKALAARASSHPVPARRTEALLALSRGTSPAAAKALGALVLDKSIESEVAHALGRSRSAHVDPWIIAMLRSPEVKRLGARAYVLRVLRGAPRLDEGDKALAALARDTSPANRAVGVFGLVATGAEGPTRFLADNDPSVRAAAAMGARPRLDDALRERMLRLAIQERDDAARSALFGALDRGDVLGIVPTPLLVDRAESASPEAALAAFALARRTEEEPSDKVRALLESRSASIRAHALLGLAESGARNVSGRLATAYAYEPDESQRRTLVRALAGRSVDASAKVRLDTLALAESLDPSPEVRFLASRARLGVATPAARGEADEIAWLRVTGPDGKPPSERGYAGALFTSEGRVVPVAFDPDGYALVPAIPPGPTRLFLAPRFPKDLP